MPTDKEISHRFVSMYKHQNTVETSTYGTELVSIMVETELNIQLDYKLTILGIEIECPTMI